MPDRYPGYDVLAKRHTPSWRSAIWQWSGESRPATPAWQPGCITIGRVWVGWPTVKAILATKIAPGLLNRYLARTGYEGQMTDEPADHGAADNLFQPLPGDYGAHGRFDARASDRSVQLWATRHRAGLLGATGLALGVAAVCPCRSPKRPTERARR